MKTELFIDNEDALHFHRVSEFTRFETTDVPRPLLRARRGVRVVMRITSLTIAASLRLRIISCLTLILAAIWLRDAFELAPASLPVENGESGRILTARSWPENGIWEVWI